MIRRLLSVVALALAVAGCNSYDIQQTVHFVDEGGHIVRVDYGVAERDHTNTFRSPTNGKEMEFRSRLVVDVTLPDWPDGEPFSGGRKPFDGESFTAWQCMNFAGAGTRYRSDSEEWEFVANGFTCAVLQRDEKGLRLAFQGVMCNTPTRAVEKDERWRTLHGRKDKRYTGQ